MNDKLNPNKILLIHPLGYDAADAEGDISRTANIMPPLGLLSIAAYLEKEGISADVLDLFAYPEATKTIDTYLLAEKPAFVGFTCTTSAFLDAAQLAEKVKATLPQTRIIVGGPHISALQEKVLTDFPIIDFAVIGEGEKTATDLIQACQQGCPANQVPGVVCRDNGQVVFTGYPKKMIDLDSLPFPAYNKLKGFPDKYLLPIFNYPSIPNTSCLSSRGCPYQCSYCDRSVFRRSFRYNAAQYLYDHIKFLNDTYGIRHINFYDDQFTVNRQRVVDFCELMKADKLPVTFNCAVRAEHVDPELLGLMKKAGCWMISLGIENGDEHLLGRHRQNPDLKMIAATLRDIKKAGIRTKGLFMLGLPGETEETVQKSLDFVLSNPIDDFNLAKFTPFPGSPLYEKIHEYGTFDEDWPKMDCMNFQFVTHGMTKERLDELFIQFYKRHYLRPKTWWNYTTMIWKSPYSYKRFFMNLPHFIKFAVTNKRIEDAG